MTTTKTPSQFHFQQQEQQKSLMVLLINLRDHDRSRHFCRMRDQPVSKWLETELFPLVVCTDGTPCKPVSLCNV